MIELNNLGIGSRVSHNDYGDGVIINVKSNYYYVTFIKEGAKEIARNNHNLTIIEAVEPPEDMVSSAEIEKTLISILRRWSDVQEEVFLHNKWQSGKLVFTQLIKHYKQKKFQLILFFIK